MKKIVLMAAVLAATAALTGCGKSQGQRMYECEEEGISRDACYQTIHQEDSARKAAITGAAQKQAMENAQALYGINGSETSGHKHHHHSED